MKRKKQIFGSCKKGNVFTESLIYIVSIFIIILVMVFSVKLFKGINPTFQTQDTITQQSKDMLNNVDNYIPTLFNNLILMIIILLWITVIVFSFLIDSHPIFFVVGFFLLMISLIVGMFIGNVYNNIAESEALSETMSYFTVANWFFTHIHIVMVLVGASILISLYVKSQYSGGTF